MIKWWNHHYPFRQQLVFHNINQSLTTTDSGLFVIPPSLIEDGKLSVDEMNWMVVYHYRNITKIVPSYIPVTPEEDDTYLQFGFATDHIPYEEIGDYYLYYGATGDNIDDLPSTGAFGVFPLYEEAQPGLSYSGPDHWEFIPAQDNPWMISSTPGATLSESAPMNGAAVMVLSGLPGAGEFRYRFDEDEWTYVDTSATDDDGDPVFFVIGGLKPELDDQSHTFLVEVLDTGNSGYTNPDDMFVINNIGSDIDEDTQALLDAHPNFVVVSNIFYSKYTSFQPQGEEVDHTLPWTTNMGGSINVGS